MWTKLRITPPGKMKLWKFYSGKKSQLKLRLEIMKNKVKKIKNK